MHGKSLLWRRWFLRGYCDSSILHCASLLRTIFASLARANEHMHVHNEIFFPQAKLDSEINVLFLLNKHGDLYFLLPNNSVHISFNLKSSKKFYRKEKKIQVKACKNAYSGMQIMTAKTTTMRTLYVHVILNGVIFRYCSICLTLSAFQDFSQVLL